MIDPRLYIAAGALVVAFSAGWLVNGWRLMLRLPIFTPIMPRKNASRVAQINSELLRRQTALEGIRKDAQDQIATADAGRDAAESAADGLRAELDRHKRRTCPATTAGGEAKESLLPELLDEVERAGRAMAQQADAAGIARYSLREVLRCSLKFRSPSSARDVCRISAPLLCPLNVWHVFCKRAEGGPRYSD